MINVVFTRFRKQEKQTLISIISRTPRTASKVYWTNVTSSLMFRSRLSIVEKIMSPYYDLLPHPTTSREFHRKPTHPKPKWGWFGWRSGWTIINSKPDPSPLFLCKPSVERNKKGFRACWGATYYITAKQWNCCATIRSFVIWLTHSHTKWWKRTSPICPSSSSVAVHLPFGGT